MLIDLTLPELPPFPATLAEVGEDFYTTSRVSLNRDIACLSCHPDINVDSKIWHVGSTPGRSARLTLTNRNLRDTPPYYRGFATSRFVGVRPSSSGRCGEWMERSS